MTLTFEVGVSRIFRETSISCVSFQHLFQGGLAAASASADPGTGGVKNAAQSPASRGDGILNALLTHAIAQTDHPLAGITFGFINFSVRGIHGQYRVSARAFERPWL